MKVPVAKPWVGEQELARVEEVLESGWLTQGPRVKAFEQAVADYSGVKHAVATTSCTTALHLALLLHGIEPGDEIVVPSYTWIATANVVKMVGAKPVFADVDVETCNVSPATLEPLLGPRTKAVLAVHQFGLPCDIDALREQLAGRGVVLIEDAACAIGSRYKGRPIGGHGSTACFSFHPRKLVTTGEGGMLTSDSDELVERCRILLNHGASVSDLAKHQAGSVAALLSEEFVELGYNYRLSDLQAAVGLAQMSRIDEVLRLRRERAERYSRELSDRPGIFVPRIPAYAEPNWQSYAVRIEGDVDRRNRVAEALLQAGVACRPAYMACHQQPYYRKESGALSLPGTETLLDTLLILPLFPQMSDAEQDYVLQQLDQALAA